MSTTLDLRGLNDAARNNLINATVATKLMGWTEYEIPNNGSYFRDVSGQIRNAAFCASSDAVRSLLETRGKDIVIVWSGGSWSVDINEDRDVGTENYNVVTIGAYDSPSLAEAACIALLRAHGVEVLT